MPLAIENLLPEAQAAEILGLKVNTLRAWSARRRGPKRVKIGRSIFYKLTSLSEWIDSHEKDPSASHLYLTDR